jgi:hypothetical protein
MKNATSRLPVLCRLDLEILYDNMKQVRLGTEFNPLFRDFALIL